MNTAIESVFEHVEAAYAEAQQASAEQWATWKLHATGTHEELRAYNAARSAEAVMYHIGTLVQLKRLTKR